MLARVLMKFSYSSDGLSTKELAAGDVHDIDDGMAVGLAAEGYIEAAPAPAVQEKATVAPAAAPAPAKAAVQSAPPAAPKPAPLPPRRDVKVPPPPARSK